MGDLYLFLLLLRKLYIFSVTLLWMCCVVPVDVSPPKQGQRYAGPVRDPWFNVPLIQFFDFGAIYILVAFPQLSFCLHFFITCLPPYLSFPMRMVPLRFQAGCCKRWLNLAVERNVWMELVFVMEPLDLCLNSGLSWMLRAWYMDCSLSTKLTSFIASTLLIGWQERHPACNFCYIL